MRESGTISMRQSIKYIKSASRRMESGSGFEGRVMALIRPRGISEKWEKGCGDSAPLPSLLDGGL